VAQPRRGHFRDKKRGGSGQKTSGENRAKNNPSEDGGSKNLHQDSRRSLTIEKKNRKSKDAARMELTVMKSHIRKCKSTRSEKKDRAFASTLGRLGVSNRMNQRRRHLISMKREVVGGSGKTTPITPYYADLGVGS